MAQIFVCSITNNATDNYWLSTDILTDKDMVRAYRENSKNGYGFTRKQLMRLVYDHEHGTEHRKRYIEYRLTDANFHHECALLMTGEYSKLRKEIMKEHEVI